MKVIIAGSRDIDNYDLLVNAIEECDLDITEVVCGGARGVDKLGEDWAALNNVPLKRFPADWAQHGRSAGPIRNAEMADYSDALIAIWDGESRGTKNMIALAKRAGLNTFVYKVEPTWTKDTFSGRTVLRTTT